MWTAPYVIRTPLHGKRIMLITNSEERILSRQLGKGYRVDLKVQPSDLQLANSEKRILSGQLGKGIG